MSKQAPAVPASLYSAELLETFAAGEHADYLAAGGRPLRPRLARSLALADLRPGQHVVDVGCGRGEAAVHAARRGARVTALDYSPGSLSLTGRSLDDLLTPGLERERTLLAASDATALPLPDACADRVLLLDLVEHLHDWQLQRLLSEIRRIIRPPGYVIIHTLPNRWALAAAYPLLRLGLPGLPADARSDYERSVHVNEQSPRSLRRALSGSGFDARVWVEEWTTRHASRGAARPYPDVARAAAYGPLGRPLFRKGARWLMRTPMRSLVGNDIFALARPAAQSGGLEGLPKHGRFRALA
jgi:SAM-dependent methyltransferase